MCGFALVVDASDTRPLSQINAENHAKELDGISNKEECPSCNGYLKRWGGRKNGKIEMPDISSPGTLQDEETISAEFSELNRDYIYLRDNGDAENTSALKKKYKNKKLFGFSVDDIVSLHEKNKV